MPLIRISTQRTPATLAWLGDDLIDWAGGWAYHLDGSSESLGWFMTYPFDAVATTVDGELACVFESRRTKGLLVQASGSLREINRSFYCAEAFDFPATFVHLPDGKTGLAHCPDRYNRIEIEDVYTGVRLTARTKSSDDAADVFHSRLKQSPSGRWLLSAGWIWHPWGVLGCFDLWAALEDPTSLDDPHRVRWFTASEVASAAFLPNDEIVVTSPSAQVGQEEEEDDEDGEPSPIDLPPGTIARVNPESLTIVSCASLQEEAGELLPLTKDLVLGVYRYPKLIEVDSGAVIRSWPDLATGDRLGAYLGSDQSRGVYALDPTGRRLAVAERGEITVLNIADD